MVEQVLISLATTIENNIEIGIEIEVRIIDQGSRIWKSWTNRKGVVES